MTARRLAPPDRLLRSEPPADDPAAPPADAAPAPEAEPTPPPGDAAPEPAPDAPAPTPDTPAEAPPVDTAPAPSADSISDSDLSAALTIVQERGVRKSALQSELGISAEKAAALLTEMEAKGIIGPAPGPGKKREILVTKWPPEAAPAEPPPAEPTPAEPEPPAGEPEPAPGDVPPAAPAEPPPAEPTPPGDVPPAEPPPEAPPATPEAAPEAPPTPPTPDTPATDKNFLRRAYERFVSKFRGEAQPEDSKEHKATGTDFVKALASGALGVVATYTGVKLLADLPQWLYQKYWTNPAERERLKSAFASRDTETGVEHATAVDQRKARLEQAINESKFLTKEKREELLAKLNTSVESYKTAEETARATRNEEIAKLVDEAIQTRVKGTQVLKEALNSALMVTGLSAMRGVAYGAVAVYERHQEVMASPERRMQYWKEMTYRGFTETAHNLIGGKADTWTGKGLNFVKGATNVLRAAGFADLAIAEWTGEGRSVSSVIETSLKAFEEKGYTSQAWENIKMPWERLGHLGEYAKSAVTGSEPTATPEGNAGAQASGAPGSPEAAGAAGVAGAAGAAAAETAPGSTVEVPEATIEAGMVKKGDGIIRILERQGIDAKSALEAAREQGIVRAGGDTRLTTEAIGRLSVFAETQPDGGIEIKFFDSETDKLLTLDQAREAGFTYESGTVPGELPTDKEIAEKIIEPSPEVPALVDSPAPNDLLNGTFHVYTDAEGRFVNMDVGEGDAISRMNDAIQELARQGHGESPEAQFIWQQMQVALASEGIEIPPADVPPADAAERGEAEVRARDAAEPAQTHADDEPLKKFKGEAGKVKFIYDKEGRVVDAFMPAYTPRPRDVEDALREWGLTNKEVRAHFFEGASRTHMDGTTIDTSHPDRYPGVERTGFPSQSPENDYRQFVRNAERLSRQEALLAEMEMEGYARTPEYIRLKAEIETLEKYVAGNMQRQFNIREREI